MTNPDPPLDYLGDFTGEEFVGYLFRGSPERRPRLWFLERHLEILLTGLGWTVSETEPTWSGDIDIDVGTWTPEPDVAYPEYNIPGLLVRYQHHGAQPWTAVWRITGTRIGHVHNFGHDDTWRLGVWPD